ncbi:aminopeptidase [Paenibacillus sp.]|uniref:aminopeptidase n=1 Tax=Paenibacillus sp. TaxID=58172 RepID=UPI002D28B077|nr:aminopeptidase [Paenibacillus sp.]HZG84505.1 aminopeptidase [Paenibacillus sp.]
MKDPRIIKLAKTIVQYSTKVQKGERVLIEMIGPERELLKSIIDEVHEAGGHPYVQLTDRAVQRTLLKSMTKENLEHWASLDLQRMKDMDVYIAVRSGENASELSGLPDGQLGLYEKTYYKPVHLDQRVRHTRWVVMRYPSPSMAQLAGMNTDAFEDFYFDVCTLDYAKMAEAMEPLSQLMSKTDKVRIVSPDTDLTFSIKGIPNVKCVGDKNLPDGELYTAPVRDSVNGTIRYNTPSVYSGITFENIFFRFENGKIVEATSNDTKKLNEILDNDEGARYIGEFSIGFNPYIQHPMKDTLFDEKIDGSLHFTPGQAYEEADNGNRSSIHWDLVLIQRPEYGGGEIWFDDRLIRKDGRFVVPELEGLNPENLK